MKPIGLIGGMSWESTSTYYQEINRAVRDAKGGLISADVRMHSFNFDEIVALQKADEWDRASESLERAAEWLASGGAKCVLICTNTMHLAARGVRAVPGLAFIDIIDETASALKCAGANRPLVLATRYTMEHGFYADQMKKHGIDVLVPNSEDRGIVHSVIFDELCKGSVLDASRAEYQRIIADGVAKGADSVIFGCTEIQMLLDPTAMPVPCFDSTQIHVEAAVRYSLS